MSQSIAQDSAHAATGRALNIFLWVLQIGAAVMFLMSAFPKLTGAPMMVGLYEAIGIGQWFRYATGLLEVAGALLLLIPGVSGIGALLLACIMVGAVATHLFIVGGSPLVPLVLLLTMAVVAWFRRQQTLRLLGRRAR